MSDKKITTDEIITSTKKKRNRPDLANFGADLVEPGDNTKYIQFALASMNLPKLDFNDVPAVQERINWYFIRCAECDMKPGVVGLANALGVDRRTLWEWKNGGRRESNTALVDTIKKAYVVLEEMWEAYMQNGKVSPPNGIFLGKNNFGYVDQVEHVITPNNPMQDLNAEDARKRLTEAIPVDDDE
jgi:hypothetical protein